MRQMQSGRIKWSRKLTFRLLLSYLVVPLVPPVLMLSQQFAHVAWQDASGIVVLYWLFGFAAIVVFGTPLLFLYLRLGWTGFLPFVIGGGLCAAATAASVGGGHTPGLVPTFGLLGVFSGVLFRIFLFGVREDSGLPEEGVTPRGQA